MQNNYSSNENAVNYFSKTNIIANVLLKSETLSTVELTDIIGLAVAYRYYVKYTSRYRY